MGAGPAQVIIGLDAGTTGVKAAASGLGSSWQRVAIREYRLPEPAPGQGVTRADRMRPSPLSGAPADEHT
jgi:sugar (pentulose or hexulose) kinase